MESPFSSKDDNQADTQNGPEWPLPNEVYVNLPGHPLYGQCVRLLQYVSANTARDCLIEDPVHPDFHYQIKATWLAATPPLHRSSATCQPTALWLDLKALDRMVQIFLIHTETETRRIQEDEPLVEPHPHPDLASTARPEPPEAAHPPLLPGLPADRRFSA